MKADQDRQARQKEEQDIKDKEDRRRQYRERLHAMEQDDSEGEFDENDESFVKPVQSMGAAEHIEDGDVPSEEEVDSQGSDDSSDDEEGNGMDEDAKLAELETREQALAEQETAEKEERARVVARAEEAAVRLSAHKDSVVPSTSDAEEDQDETAGDVDEELDTESYVQHMTAKSTAGATQATEATIVDAEEEEGEPVVKVRKAAKNERYIKMLMEDGKKKVVCTYTYPIVAIVTHMSMSCMIRCRPQWLPFLTRRLRRRRRRASRGACWISASGRRGISLMRMRKR